MRNPEIIMYTEGCNLPELSVSNNSLIKIYDEEDNLKIGTDNGQLTELILIEALEGNYESK